MILEFVQIVMPKYTDPSPGKAAAVDEGGVVQLVAEEMVPLSGKSGENRKVRLPPAWKEQRGFGPQPAGCFLFRFPMGRKIPTKKPGGGSARAPGIQGLLRCKDDSRVLGKSQVAVAGEIPALRRGESAAEPGGFPEGEFLPKRVGESFGHRIQTGMEPVVGRGSSPSFSKKAASLPGSTLGVVRR